MMSENNGEDGGSPPLRRSPRHARNNGDNMDVEPAPDRETRQPDFGGGNEGDAPLHRSLSLSGAQVIVESPATVSISAQVYTFFNRIRKNELRAVNRFWQKRTYGNKPEYVYRAYRHVMYKHGLGRDVGDIITNNPHCSCFEEFVKSMDETAGTYVEPPLDAEIDAALRSDPPLRAISTAGQRSGTGSQAGAAEGHDEGGRHNDDPIQTEPAGTPNFSLSELARLIIVLRDDQMARRALFQLCQELSRGELDSGVTRDHFWVVVAQRFNNPATRSTFSFAGTVDEADPSVLPLCERNAGTLKSHFLEARGKFTLYRKKWEQSGENDPMSFPNLLPRYAGGLYSVSKKVWIIFTANRLGTAYADTAFVDMTSKLCAAGYEEGMPNPGSAIREGEATQKGSSSGSRKRRRSGPEAVERLNSRFDTVEGYLKQAVPRPTEQCSETIDLSGDMGRKILITKQKDELFSLLDKAHERLRKARERNDDPEFVELAVSHYKKAKEDYYDQLKVIEEDKCRKQGDNTRSANAAT